MKTARAVAIAVGGLAIVGWLLHELGSRPRTDEPASRAQTVTTRATERADLDTLLAGMTWRDVQTIAERLGARPAMRDDLLARAAGHWRPEALYLRGLLLLAAQRPDESLASFAIVVRRAHCFSERMTAFSISAVMPRCCTKMS